MNPDIFKNEILRGVVGSTSYGAAIEGQDDRDEMGVFIELPKYVCGLDSLDHYIQRDRPDGVRSQPGDLDLTLYSLRKFVRLAAQGNPSVVVLLWLERYELMTEMGQRLVDLRQEFISRDSGERFLGYLISQKKRLTGELSRAVNRPELVEKYGFDTKFAMHALRLGMQGCELLGDGRLTLPMRANELSVLKGVRVGKYTFAETLEMINETEEKLRILAEKCEKRVDKMRINQFLVDSHLEYWGRISMISF